MLRMETLLEIRTVKMLGMKMRMKKMEKMGMMIRKASLMIRKLMLVTGMRR